MQKKVLAILRFCDIYIPDFNHIQARYLQVILLCKFKNLLLFSLLNFGFYFFLYSHFRFKTKGG
jgi:hypothetical protein